MTLKLQNSIYANQDVQKKSRLKPPSLTFIKPPQDPPLFHSALKKNQSAPSKHRPYSAFNGAFAPFALFRHTKAKWVYHISMEVL